MPKNSLTKRTPSEVNWSHSNNNNISHIDFFNFFKTYNRRRAHTRFLEVVKFIEDEVKRNKVLEDYEQWCKSREVKEFWAQRKLANQDSTGTTTAQQTDTTSTAPTEEIIESISLADAKAIMLKSITPVDDNSSDHSFSNSLSKFRRCAYVWTKFIQ